MMLVKDISINHNNANEFTHHLGICDVGSDSMQGVSKAADGLSGV